MEKRRINSYENMGTLKSMYTKFMVVLFIVVLFAGITSSLIVLKTRMEQVRNMMEANLKSTVGWVRESASNYPRESIDVVMEKCLGENYHYTQFPTAIEAIEKAGLLDHDKENLYDKEFTNMVKVIEQGGAIFVEGSDTVSCVIVKIRTSYFIVGASSDAFISLPKLFYSVIWTSGVLTLITVLALNSVVIRLLIKPITQVAQGMAQVTKGDFNIKIKEKGDDEIAYLQHNFNKMVEGLKENEALSKNFVSTVSHEYKTPIASIMGYATLIEKESQEENVRNYAEIIKEQSMRLTNLSINLLQISRLDSNVIGNEQQEYSLDEQIRDIILKQQTHWESKQIELDIDLDEVKVKGNPNLTYHVWENILNNAIKFSYVGGQITVKLLVVDKNNSKYAKVSFTDQGVGIPESQIDKVFDRFYRKIENNPTGTGLGLSIVKSIVDSQKGEIMVESQENKGTTFTILLPTK